MSARLQLKLARTRYIDPSVNPTIQLAGSVGNGATGGTWSGGAGTFTPDANTTNAVYTPSAGELAAGSWALTLTTTTPCGTATDTMHFFFIASLRLPLVTSQSWEVETISIDLLRLGWKNSDRVQQCLGLCAGAA